MSDKKTIVLSRPIKVNGVDTAKLEMREPIVADQLAASKASGGDQAKAEVILVANVCMISPADLEQMPLCDYKKVQAAFLEFVG